ncbi:hypothetical protein QYE76_013532 [Lolium multiflorum]|uniref:Uncharacterized protein n=1 Tax=Lolium multiflorum TaxID=4521 RepID=A0AAD8TYZ6_LOLMU|nr:hypothetical protein QYE76_013532 [Lolium multiflorum]
MNPENRGQQTTRPSKLQVRRAATTEGGSSTNASPLPEAYAAVPLRMAWRVDLENGHHGTVISAVPAAPTPWMMNPTNMPLFQSAPAAAPPAAAPQHEYEKPGLFLIKMLHSCAAAVAEGETELLNIGLKWISCNASDDGEEPMQRLASAFADALARRMVQPWLQHIITTPDCEAAAAHRHFTAMCPFLRISGAVANHAIIDVAEVQPGRIVHIHVIDIGDTDPHQWLQLLRIFATQSPNLILRMTIVNKEEEFLSQAADLLTKEAVRLRVGFLFHPVRLNIDQFSSVDALDVRSGEVLVVVSTLQLHRLLEFAEVSSTPHDRKGKTIQAHGSQQHTMTRADTLLRDLRQLSPKLVVVTEQEADHNGADFKVRFQNALVYYGALFDALEESVPSRGSAEERACVERHLLRDEIMDIISHDGAQRRHRHEKVEGWAARMDAAGFSPAAVMRQDVVAQATMLVRELLPDGAYRVSRVNDERLFIYRNAIPMFSISTWHAV